MVEEKPSVTIHTDGDAEPNPGPGGYGVVLRFGNHRKELSGGFEHTTCDRMELLAVIVGLEALNKPCEVTVYSGSRRVVDAVCKGTAQRWRSDGWRGNATQRVRNVDLWERFFEVYERHSVTLEWVPDPHENTGNERSKHLAVAAANSDQLLSDRGDASEPSRRIAKRLRNSRKSKITHTTPGEPCRKCGCPLVKRTPRRQQLKPGQSYYYDWYLYCPDCQAMYMVESAKREKQGGVSLFNDTESPDEAD